MADLALIETFVAVAGAGSFAGAARRLGLSAAMVGRRVRALEDRHGARLVERTTRALRLTETGQAFLARALEVVEAVEALDDLTAPEGGRVAGRVRLTGPATLGASRLAAIVAAACARHPGLSVELALSDRPADLVAEGFDLAVRIGRLAPSGLIARRVGTYRFAVCAAPAHLARHGTPATPQGLAGAACILNLNLQPRTRWPFAGAGAGEDGQPFAVEVRGRLEMDSDAALRAAALAGAGLVYVPRDLVAADLASGALVEVLAGWRTLELPIHAVHPSRRLLPRRVSAMVEALAEGLRERGA